MIETSSGLRKPVPPPLQFTGTNNHLAALGSIFSLIFSHRITFFLPPVYFTKGTGTFGLFVQKLNLQYKRNIAGYFTSSCFRSQLLGNLNC